MGRKCDILWCFAYYLLRVFARVKRVTLSHHFLGIMFNYHGSLTNDVSWIVILINVMLLTIFLELTNFLLNPRDTFIQLIMPLFQHACVSFGTHLHFCLTQIFYFDVNWSIIYIVVAQNGVVVVGLVKTVTSNSIRVVVSYWRVESMSGHYRLYLLIAFLEKAIQVRLYHDVSLVSRWQTASTILRV